MAKAKNAKKVTVEVSAIPVQNAPTAADVDWRTRDDASEIMRMGDLMRDKSRLRRAENYIRGAMSVMGIGRKGSRIKSKRGRRTAARNIGKR